MISCLSYLSYDFLVAQFLVQCKTKFTFVGELLIEKTRTQISCHKEPMESGHPCKSSLVEKIISFFCISYTSHKVEYNIKSKSVYRKGSSDSRSYPMVASK